MKTSLITLASLLSFTSLAIHAQESALEPEHLAQTRCFEFEIQNPSRGFEIQRPTIVGCYLPLDDARQMVFVKDQDGANLLTSALVGQTENGQEMVHFSKAAGVTTKVTQSSLKVNPLPVPPTLEKALENSTREIEDLSIYSDALRGQINEIIPRFYANEINSAQINAEDLDEISIPKNLAMAEMAYLSPDKQPADGYWWPHTNLPMARDSNSPLAKYDAYVENVTGKNPNSLQWERNHHNTDTFWAGHCNGWAASTILHGYHEGNLFDPVNRTTITSSDLQGLRSEASFCVSSAFFGTRYNGPGDNINDITPEEFHRTLKYYILLLQKPVVMDYLSAEKVDNHIVSGYTITYESLGSGKYLAKAKLRVHEYSYTPVSTKRIAKTYEKTYSYWAWKDSRGRMVRSQWVNPLDHPDFMWVPVSEQKCGGENPRVDPKYIDHMIRNLRRAGPGRIGG